MELLFHKPALPQRHAPIAFHRGSAMGNAKDGAVLRQRLDKIQNPFLVDGVQTRGGLVKQQYVRLGKQELAKGYACFLASGKGVDGFGEFILAESQAF